MKLIISLQRNKDNNTLKYCNWKLNTCQDYHQVILFFILIRNYLVFPLHMIGQFMLPVVFLLTRHEITLKRSKVMVKILNLLNFIVSFFMIFVWPESEILLPLLLRNTSFVSALGDDFGLRTSVYKIKASYSIGENTTAWCHLTGPRSFFVRIQLSISS